jgi:hypothetical protein
MATRWILDKAALAVADGLSTAGQGLPGLTTELLFFLLKPSVLANSYTYVTSLQPLAGQ